MEWSSIKCGDFLIMSGNLGKKSHPLNYSLYSYSELEAHRHVEQLCFRLKKDFSGRGETWGRCHFCWIFHLAQQKVGRKQQLLADIGEEVCDLCRAGCTDLFHRYTCFKVDFKAFIYCVIILQTVRSNRSDPQKWLVHHLLLPLSPV